VSFLTIEGMAVPVNAGASSDVTPFGDVGPAFSGLMRSDIRAHHRMLQVTTVEMETADMQALRAILRSPGPLLIGGDWIGQDAYFTLLGGVRVQPLPTADDYVLQFTLRETADAPALLLFSFDGDAPGEYTFTRTGATATEIDENGVLSTVAANILRTDHLDLDGDGIRGDVAVPLERGTTNELFPSENLNDGVRWTKTNLAGVTVNQAVGPDGATSLDAIVEDGTNSSHEVSQAVTGMTADANYALSGWFIASTRTWVRLHILETAASANIVRAWFNLATGAVGTTNAGGTGTFLRAYVEDWTDVVEGLYRCVLVGSVGNSATAITGVAGLASGDGVGSYQGDGSSRIFGGYMQLEDDTPAATTYVSTTTVAVARGAEAFSAPFVHAPQAMTIYAKLIERGNSGTAGVLQIGTATGAGDARIGLQFSSSAYRAIYNNGSGANQTVSPSASPSVGQPFELMATIDEAGNLEFTQVIDDGAPEVETNATGDALPAAWQSLLIHLNATGTSNVGLMAGEAIKIVGSVKTLAEMRKIAGARLFARVA